MMQKSLDMTTWLRRKIMLIGLKVLLKNSEALDDEKLVVTLHPGLPGEMFTEIECPITIGDIRELIYPGE